MKSDEAQIRELVSTWMAATKSGDVETVLSLMTDDVVFLIPGRPVMRKGDFAAAAKSQASAGLKFDGKSDIQEVKVSGDWAFMWSKLTVVAEPPDGTAPTVRAGHTLTVFHRENGHWLLARDANLLGPVQQTSSDD